ncbi:hypothetical protein BVX95_01830 [archaeon D22]|nr:hypothetical protein BVX95_01830 [archaeon D22]
MMETKRKIIKQGNGAYTITLPIDWIRKNKIADGFVTIENNNELLTIDPRGLKETQKEITINLEASDKIYLRTLISGLYRQGYDIVTLKHEIIDKKIVYEIVNSLFGMEIVDDAENHIIIKNISSENYQTDALAIKICQRINQMLHSLLEPDNKTADIDIFRQNNMKTRDLCLRNLQKTSDETSHELYSLILSLEKISGELYIISQGNREKLNFLDLKICQEYCNQFYDAYFSSDFQKLTNLNKVLQKKIKNNEMSNSAYFIINSLYSAVSRALSTMIIKKFSKM